MKSSLRVLVPIAVLVVAAASFGVIVGNNGWTWQEPKRPAVAASSPGVQARQPIRIGVPVGISGANGMIAPSVLQSAELAVDEINAAGGILGRPVKLEVADDHSDAAGARRAMASLLDDRKVDAVIAMQTSAARGASMPLLAAAQVPYIYTSFYEGGACNPWLHANGWVPQQQVTPIVKYLMENKGAKSFLLVGSDYAFGRGMLEYAKKLIRAGGGSIAGEEYLPIDATDWRGVIAKIRASRPDALISATAGGSPNVLLAEHLKAANIAIPYGNLAIDESTAKAMGDLATGMLVAGSYFTSIETPENTAFLRRMLARHGAALKAPNELSVPEYEALYLYKAAVEAAGTTEGARVVAALSTVAIAGPRGEISMNRHRHAALPMRLGRVRSDGSIAILSTFSDVSPGIQCPELQ